MAEKPEDLNLPASVVTRIVKEAVRKINNFVVGLYDNNVYTRFQMV